MSCEKSYPPVPVLPVFVLVLGADVDDHVDDQLVLVCVPPSPSSVVVVVDEYLVPEPDDVVVFVVVIPDPDEYVLVVVLAFEDADMDCGVPMAKPPDLCPPQPRRRRSVMLGGRYPPLTPAAVHSSDSMSEKGVSVEKLAFGLAAAAVSQSCLASWNRCSSSSSSSSALRSSETGIQPFFLADSPNLIFHAWSSTSVSSRSCR